MYIRCALYVHASVGRRYVTLRNRLRIRNTDVIRYTCVCVTMFTLAMRVCVTVSVWTCVLTVVK